jgi:hypothetical protein
MDFNHKNSNFTESLCDEAMLMSPSLRAAITSFQSIRDSQFPCFSRGLTLFWYNFKPVTSKFCTTELF